MKKIASVFLSLVLMCSILFIPSFEAKAESITVNGIPSEAKIGDTFSFTVAVPANIGGFAYVEYDKDVLEYVSGPQESSNGLIRYTVFFESSPQTIKFKVKSAGKTTIKVYMEDAEYSDTTDKFPSLSTVTKTVTVSNETDDTELSSDYYLAKLNITAGSKAVTLSPTFKYSKTSYTATVDYDVTEVVVSATRSSGKAEIVSITDNGTVKLNVGANKIEIVVKAENGKTLTYTATVTRKEKPAETEKPDPTPTETPVPSTPDFEQGGTPLYTVETPDDKIPADFVEKTVILTGGKEVQGLSFQKTDLTVLYLQNESKVGSLYIYNAQENAIYPFVKLSAGENYVIVLMPEDESAPEGYTACTLSIEGKGIVNAYQLQTTRTVDMSDFYLIYCVNNNGTKGWYQYDSLEGTYQRYTGNVNTPGTTPDTTPGTEPGSTQESEEPGTLPSGSDSNPGGDSQVSQSFDWEEYIGVIICAVVFLAAVVAIIVINRIVAANRKANGEEEDDDDDDYDEYAEYKYSEDEDVIEATSQPKEEKATEEREEVEFLDL